MFVIEWLCVFVLLLNISDGQYQIPPVILEAFKPKGFRAAIVADKNTEMFAFHGRKNAPLNLIEPGNFSEDVKIPKDGHFTYFNKDLQLKVGDVIYYWVHVQNSQLGYRKDGQQWKVSELKPLPEIACASSITKISDRLEVCPNDIIFEDEFDGGSLDESKWTVEQYIPGEPDHEFVIYKKDPRVTRIESGTLFVSPRMQTEQAIEESILDLSPGCTKKPADSDYCRHEKYLIQNPVLSGKIVSKQTFSYGDLEVRAKLPRGDWIYPEIYLEDANGGRILIAYSRGNAVLTGSDKNDIGGSLLFGGPILGHREPARSSKLSSSRSRSGVFSDQFHVYRLKWTKDAMELYVDGEIYGDIRVGNSISPDQVRLVLGVGVGGISDFPDDFLSGANIKPWKNSEAKQVKKFYDKREEWLPTWTRPGLVVDYVKIKAI